MRSDDAYATGARRWSRLRLDALELPASASARRLNLLRCLPGERSVKARPSYAFADQRSVSLQSRRQLRARQVGVADSVQRPVLLDKAHVVGGDSSGRVVRRGT